MKYAIARNKTTGLVDVIDLKAGQVVSRGHPTLAAAQAVAAKLLEANETSNDYVSDNGQFGVGA